VFNKETKPIAKKFDKEGFSIKVNGDADKETVYKEVK